MSGSERLTRGEATETDQFAGRLPWVYRTVVVLALRCPKQQFCLVCINVCRLHSRLEYTGLGGAEGALVLLYFT